MPLKKAPDPDIWRPVEELAAEWDAPVSEIMSLILDGDLEGRRCDYRWYVVRPVVILQYPDPNDRSEAELRFRALRMGNYLTAGRSELVVPIRHGDVGVREALDLAWGIDESKPPMAATVRFGSQDWVVDASLSRDLARCLLSFDVDFELQENRGGEDTCG
jgi:hypothetical protein